MLAGEVQQPSTRPYRTELHGETGCQFTVNTHEFRLSGVEWWRAEGGQVLSHPSRMTLEQSRMPAAFNRAQHRPDNMRRRRH